MTGGWDVGWWLAVAAGSMLSMAWIPNLHRDAVARFRKQGQYGWLQRLRQNAVTVLFFAYFCSVLWLVTTERLMPHMGWTRAVE